MKLSIEEILNKIEELDDYMKTRNFISSLYLTPKQMDILVNHEDEDVRFGLAQNPNLTDKIILKLTQDKNEFVKRSIARHPNLPKDLMYKWGEHKNWLLRVEIIENPNLPKVLVIKLNCDKSIDMRNEISWKLQKINSLEKEELEEAYDLIRKSKYINRKNFKDTFDYIANNFPEVSKLAEIFKTIILKGKKDLK